MEPGIASASPCIEVDQTKDTLTAQEQKAAINTFEAVLSSQGVSLDDCVPFVLAHSRLGDVITVQVSRGGDIRTLRAETLSDLPAAYDQIVISFMSGEPLTKSVRRNNVLQAQSKREKEAVDSLFFLGFSGTGSSLSEEVMPGFHLLTRFETDAHAFGFGLDLSVGTQEQTTDAFSSRTTGAARWSFGLDYAYFFAPLDSSVSMRVVAWVIVVMWWENEAGQGSMRAQHWAWSFLGHPPHVSRWSYALLCHFIRSNHHRIPLNGTLESP